MPAKENQLKRLEDAFDKDGFLQMKAIYQMDFVRRLYYHQTGLIVDRVLGIRRFGE